MNIEYLVVNYWGYFWVASGVLSCIITYIIQKHMRLPRSKAALTMDMFNSFILGPALIIAYLFVWQWLLIETKWRNNEQNNRD